MENKVLMFLSENLRNVVGTNSVEYRLEISLQYGRENKLKILEVKRRGNGTAFEYTVHKLVELTSKETKLNCEMEGGIKQSYCSTNNNKEMKEYDGNKNNNLVIACWNCGKKLFLPDGNPSTKWKEILEFVKTYKVDMTWQ